MKTKSNMTVKDKEKKITIKVKRLPLKNRLWFLWCVIQILFTKKFLNAKINIEL